MSSYNTHKSLHVTDCCAQHAVLILLIYNNCYPNMSRLSVKLHSKRQTSSSTQSRCILCVAKSHGFTRYANVGNVEREYISKHMKEPPCNESLMCRKHVLDRRHHNTPGFTPKWKTLQQKVVQMCINPNCTHLHYGRVHLGYEHVGGYFLGCPRLSYVSQQAIFA